MELDKKVNLTFEQWVFLGELESGKNFETEINKENVELTSDLLSFGFVERREKDSKVSYILTELGAEKYEKARECFNYRR
ncbi:MAG: hypothetical protein WC812_01790 [Candidatus Pacearchaeota archaeon]|jgi:predicted transcriptional regulator